MSNMQEQWQELGKAIGNIKEASGVSIPVLQKASEEMSRIARQIGPYSEEELEIRKNLRRQEKVEKIVVYAAVVIVVAIMVTLFLLM